MGQLKQAFAKLGSGIKQLGSGIKNDFYKLKHGFTVRSFFTILFGFVLFAGNAYIFVASAIERFASYGVWALLHIGFGLLGFLVSCLLIFLLTLHFSVTPQEDTDVKNDEGIFSDSMSVKKRIVAFIIVFLMTFGGGGAALGYYISGELKYQSYPETTATVVAVINNVAFYEYTVDGVTYRANGKLESSGEASPMLGDTVTVKYDPDNPGEIRISTEAKFFLGFGSFLIFFGLTIIVIGLYSAKKLKTQFLLAFILLGLSVCIFLCYLSSMEFTGLVEFFARNFTLHFIMIFTNVGFLELINGIVYIGYKKRR